MAAPLLLHRNFKERQMSEKISSKIEKNEEYVRKRLKNCDDFIIRPMVLGEGKKIRCLVVYMPSITRRSLMYVAEHYLGLEVEERPVYFDEVKDFAECGLCGTAAVISPVGKINDHGKEICFPSGMDEMGPITKKLYDTLTGIQMGHIEAPEGWIHRVE